MKIHIFFQDMDKFLILSISLSICALAKADGNVSVIEEKENRVELPVKQTIKSTLSPRSLHSSTRRSVKPTVPSTLSPHHQPSSGSFPRVAVSSAAVFVLFTFLVVCLVYNCCNQTQAPEGFTEFNNENERNPLTRPSRWRSRHFFWGNGHPNQLQSSPGAGNSTHVTVQPVLNLNFSSGDQSSTPRSEDCRTVPPMHTSPQACSESLNNLPIPNEMNPPMSSQFVNPPIPSQYMSPPMPGQFMNPPMPSQLMNPPMANNFNSPPTSIDFNSPLVRAQLYDFSRP